MNDYFKFRSYLQNAGLSYDCDPDSSHYVILYGSTPICNVSCYDARHDFAQAKSVIDFAMSVERLLQ